MLAVVEHSNAAAASKTAVAGHSSLWASTASQPDSYVYDALPDQHFRLIRVVRRGAELISCEIKTCSRLQNPAYAALSYAWGEPPDTHFISIEGRRKAIRENLWHFLHDATTQDEWLWIDAVCIDQDDLEERSQQLQMMTSIYRFAERVYIWLGSSTVDSDTAMRLISRTTVSDQRQALDAHTFEDLLQRPYWTRLWVFQELLLSGRKILCCGSETAPFEAFRYLLMDDADRAESDLDLDRFLNLRDYPARSMLLLTALNAQHNLISLMSLTKHLACAEVHDRAYALLGVHPLGSRGVATDYGMPIPHLLNSILSSHLEVDEPRSLDDVRERCRLLSLAFGQEDMIFQLHEDGAYPAAYQLPAGADLAKDVSCESIAWALYYGHTPVLELIVSKHKEEAHAWLWQAAAQEIVRTAEVLLRCGARLIASSESKPVPTLIERISRLEDRTMVQLLIDYKLLSNQQLGIAQMITAGLHGAVAGGNISMLKFWLFHLAHTTTYRDYDVRISALSAAQQSRNRQAMDTILDYQMRPDLKSWLETSALSMAATAGDVQLGEMLCSRGAHLIEPGSLVSSSVLGKAIEAGQTSFVQWALDKHGPVSKSIQDDWYILSPVVLAAEHSSMTLSTFY